MIEGVAGDAGFIQDAGAGAFSFPGDLEYFCLAFRCLLKLGSTTVYVDQKLCPGLELTVFKDPFFSGEKDPLAELRRWRDSWPVFALEEGAVGLRWLGEDGSLHVVEAA